MSLNWQAIVKTFSKPEPTEKKTMTTLVKVTAHCNRDTQVRITGSDVAGAISTSVVIHNGETDEQSVYDNWRITVTEEPKQAA